MSHSKTFQYYVSDLGKLLLESAREARAAREKATGPKREFESGRTMAYYEVISTMRGQAIAFGLPLKDVGLEGVDPDNELI